MKTLGVISAEILKPTACVDVCRPADLGFDIVLESATKYMGGHSDLIAGVYAGSKANVQKVSSWMGQALYHPLPSCFQPHRLHAACLVQIVKSWHADRLTELLLA